MRQWYLSYGGDALGPFDHDQTVAQARKDPSGHAWRESSLLGAVGGLNDGDNR